MTMKKNSISIFLSFIICSTAAFGGDFKPDLSEGIPFSNPEDLVAHCSTFAFDRHGNIFFAYYKDAEQPKEHSVNLSTFPVLAKGKLSDMTSFERTDVIRSGQTIGDFTHGPRAPYDPNILRLGKKMKVFFNGCVGTEVTYCSRDYNLKENRFEDHVTISKLRYKLPGGESRTITLDAKGCYEFFDDMGIQAEYHNDLVISARFVPYKGEYYSVLCGVFSKASKPVIVKTRDGETFDVVLVCRDFEYGACEGCMEIVGKEYYVTMRNSGCPKELQGTYVAKYDFDGRCLVAPKKLGRCQSKTAVINWKGNVYAIFNEYPNLNTEWGNVTRSRLRIARLDKDCNMVAYHDILSEVGIHYPYVDIHKGKLYMSYTEDRKKVDVKQCRSNVSIIRLKGLENL